MNTMAEKEIPNVLTMAIFMVTRNDVFSCADELGIAREKLTADVIEQVQEVVSEGIGGLQNTVRHILKEALKEKGNACLSALNKNPSLKGEGF